MNLKLRDLMILLIGSFEEHKMKNVFCIIPARGGSKRIPNKNIQLVNGIPLISITLTNLLAADIFEDVFVSTDSKEIQDISIKYGAVSPFLRPKEISDDFTPTIDVVRHALVNLPNILEEDIVACVYPTAALLAPSIFKSATARYVEQVSPLSFLIAVAHYPHPIQRSFRLDSQSKIEFIQPEFLETRTQDLATSYYDAGQFYIGRKSLWLNSGSVFENAYGFEIPGNSFVDIDYPEDLEELRIRIEYNQTKNPNFESRLP